MHSGSRPTSWLANPRVFPQELARRLALDAELRDPGGPFPARTGDLVRSAGAQHGDGGPSSGYPTPVEDGGRRKAKITEEGLLIPGEIAERLCSEEVEILEEPGRLLIVSSGAASRVSAEGTSPEDPIRGLGRASGHTGGRRRALQGGHESRL